jgi:hypothetical protein
MRKKPFRLIADRQFSKKLLGVKSYAPGTKVPTVDNTVTTLTGYVAKITKGLDRAKFLEAVIASTPAHGGLTAVFANIDGSKGDYSLVLTASACDRAILDPLFASPQVVPVLVVKDGARIIGHDELVYVAVDEIEHEAT